MCEGGKEKRKQWFQKAYNNMTTVLQQSLWKVQTEQIDPNHYFGVMVANGMIGMVSDAYPMHIQEVVLNGVYDRYQRGRVSNILVSASVGVPPASRDHGHFQCSRFTGRCNR